MVHLAAHLAHVVRDHSREYKQLRYKHQPGAQLMLVICKTSISVMLIRDVFDMSETEARASKAVFLVPKVDLDTQVGA